MTDKFVYSQKELELALNEGHKSIILCAGIFNIPLWENTTFKRIGPVKVTVLSSRLLADNANMTFIDIYPKYIDDFKTPENSIITTTPNFASFSSVRPKGSGSHIHYYEYEYEYGTSFSSSFHNSFTGGYSFYHSYSLGSNSNLFCEYVSSRSDNTERTTKIHVFGYGIDLI